MYLENSKIIRRPKHSGLGWHLGIELPNGYVAHNTPEKNFHISTIDEFAEGKPVEPIAMIDEVAQEKMISNIQQMLRSGISYDGLNNNCEHSVMRALGDMPHSPQIRGWLALGAIALFVSACASAQKD
jgi:hypothetical protein